MSYTNKYRIGTDIPMQLTLMDSDVNISWDDVTVDKVAIYNDTQEAFGGLCSFSVNSSDATKLDVVYDADDQIYLGECRLVVIVTAEGSQATYDAEAFTLVATTDEATGIPTEDEPAEVGITVTNLPSSTITAILNACIAATAECVATEASVEAAEAERDQAEIAREDNETAREGNEESRVSAEASRVSAEQDRVVSENARSQAEVARGTAEGARATAEAARATAEESRVSAEASRVSAEESRVTAEASRVTAETARQTGYSEFDGRISTNEELLELLKRDLGYNASSSTVALTAGVTGAYVKCASRVAVANASFNISAPINVDACSEILIKTGFNPSDSDHSSLDLSVISFVHSIERQRKVQAVDSDNNPLYYQVDEDGNPTTETGTTVTGYPVYTTETYTDTIYTPNNVDKYVAIPDSGYYVANIPDAAQIVISYKPGVTDTNIIIVKHGNFANIVSQLGMLAFKERLPMVQSLTQLKEDLVGLRKIVLDNMPDLMNIPTVLGVPFVLMGHGVPSSSVVPTNWPSDLPWDGVPFFPGQLYINLDVSSGGLYHAKGNSAVSDWVI